MNKKMALAIFNQEIRPNLRKNDKPQNYEAWNNFVDYLQKAGEISEARADQWVKPAYMRKWENEYNRRK